jgi:hypothetical protein
MGSSSKKSIVSTRVAGLTSTLEFGRAVTFQCLFVLNDVPARARVIVLATFAFSLLYRGSPELPLLFASAVVTCTAIKPTYSDAGLF